MTTRRELDQKYQEVQNGEIGYDDYRKHYLVPFWNERAQNGKWQEVVSDNFRDRHTVDGTVSKEKAVDILRDRSGNFTRPFTSTLISEKLMRKVVAVLAKNNIPSHPQRFTNYSVGDAEGMVWVAWTTGDGRYQVQQNRTSVIVGINEPGILNHFHGDFDYPE